MDSKDINKDRRKQTVEQEIKRRTIVSFSVFIICMACGWFAFSWLYHQPPTADNTQPLFRKSFEANELLFSKFYSKMRTARTFQISEADTNVNVNAHVGMKGMLDTAIWRLKVARKPGDTLVLTLNDIKALPKVDIVFNFKCVEGWSQVSWWGGVRFADFLKKYNLVSQTGMRYVGLVTPDGTYYVGNDMPSMLQPQTILCYEMNGKTLPNNQGYPLRLIIPVKYGIKHLMRIGVIHFSNEKPADYWAERGYDYYSGL